MSLYVGINNKPMEVTRLLLGTGIGYNEIISAYTGGVNLNSDKVYDNFSVDKELTKVNPVKALISGEFTSADIGKTVYLSNGASPCQEWRVADVNHDGTVGTVDLFPKYVVNNGIVFGDDEYYSSSDLRSWLIGTFYNGFSDEVKNALKVQSFPCNGGTLNDKVKCPSLNEVGLTSTYNTDLIYEGTIYPIFGNSLIDGTNPLSKYTTTNGSAVHYWTRSRDPGYSYYVWDVNPDGNRYYYTSFRYSLGAVACLRF